MNQKIRASAIQLIQLAMVMVILMSYLPIHNVLAKSLPNNVQPYLLHLAQSTPSAPVRVIIQQSTPHVSLANAIADLGGTVTADLSIINAIAVELRAEAVPQLASIEGVRWISYDAPVLKTGGPDGTVSMSNLKNVYDQVVNAPKAWSQGYQGSSVSVAVVDSGITSSMDLMGNAQNRKLADVAFYDGYEYNGLNQMAIDGYGHGTHVAGIIGGNGANSSGKYIGIAPKVKLLNVKVSNDQGAGTIANVVKGLQWIYRIRMSTISVS